MSGDRFRGVWKVIANRMRHDYPDEHYALIEPLGDGTYRLSSGLDRQGPFEIEQELKYNAETGMLENKEEDRGRVVAFWNRSANNSGLKDCIFAMRRKPGEYWDEGDLLPWERPVNEDGESDPDGTAYVGNNGSWGAEGG